MGFIRSIPRNIIKSRDPDTKTLGFKPINFKRIMNNGTQNSGTLEARYSSACTQPLLRRDETGRRINFKCNFHQSSIFNFALSTHPSHIIC